MLNNFQRVLVSAVVFSVLFTGSLSSAAPDSGKGSDSGVAETQKKRSAERFDIISYLRNQEATIRGQNSKYGGSGSHSSFFADIVLKYEQDTSDNSRDSVKLGTGTMSGGRAQFLMDDLFVKGDKKRSMNVDIGFEGFYHKTRSFVPHELATQTNHNVTDLGGGLLIRPMGKSSQDSGLLVKVGYMDIVATGLFANTTTDINLYGTYLGTEATLYLAPFLGLKAEYLAVLENENKSLGGKWKYSNFTYGGFLEIYLIRLELDLFTREWALATDTGTPVKDVITGTMLSAGMYF